MGNPSRITVYCGILKLAKLPPTEGDQGVMGDVRSWRGENTRTGRLAEVGVGHPDNLYLVDRRMP